VDLSRSRRGQGAGPRAVSAGGAPTSRRKEPRQAQPGTAVIRDQAAIERALASTGDGARTLAAVQLPATGGMSTALGHSRVRRSQVADVAASGGRSMVYAPGGSALPSPVPAPRGG